MCMYEGDDANSYNKINYKPIDQMTIYRHEDILMKSHYQESHFLEINK